MKTIEKIVAIFSFFLGISILFFGAYLAYESINYSFDSLLAGVISLSLFLPITLIAILIGTSLAILSVLSFRSHAWAYKVNLGLVTVSIASMFFLFYLFNSLDQEAQQQYEETQELLVNSEKIYSINEISIAELNETGFKIYLDFEGEGSGTYNLNLFVEESSERIIFSNFSEEIFIDSANQRFELDYNYDGLFEKCFTEPFGSKYWICSPEAGGYGFVFTITTTLDFIENSEFKYSDLEYNFDFQSTNEKSFSLDLTNDGNQMIAENFQLL
ncbi:hypothetical protein HN604_00165 [archaeon]|jgi:hypothetical protein|nr:hypothetical protein [archaeon]MBT6183080.1 hypothetical protein [archaeon]MBT6606407.1 hypothetical protein [archaeon]MBT7251424.1 hypothetical protein [archaeon]MBT7660479.1 hypothetical protein [archaeon]